MMRLAIQNRRLKGFKLSNREAEGLEIYQGDDTVIFCEAKTEHISYIRVILLNF